MVNIILKTVRKGQLEYIPWPDDYEKIETGDSIADIKLLQNLINFRPNYSIEDGIRLTFEYYKKYSKYYK